ncbi:sigma-54-dependent Fis family transcriptional regulator [Pseudomonas sp. Q2-TVG4-2]|uniref:sigma-54-dependent Fis family transcriptional regulator n=1 Tax=Pseudomonas sp. Q2-TVG4-2 TaxID=1685699 RepID=UPI0015E7A9DC|nr:sigma-54-dependent Fis family transcriptional regulator [Pseudomonas sp. Q2-TVG4-2]
METLPRPQIVVLISHLQRPAQSSRLAQVVRSVMPDYADETTIRVIDTSVYEALQTATDLEKRGQVDVFICAGATAAYLRKHLTRPVLSMRVGGSDLLRSLDQACARSAQIAIVSYNHINLELKSVAPLLTVQVEQASYTTLEGARKAVQRMRELGCETIIGSSTVVELAEQDGLHGVLSVSADTARKALEEALGILHSQRIEIAKRRHLDGVLRHIPTGVAALDNNGIVRSINPALEQLLGVQANLALGRPLHELNPAIDVADALRSGIGEENKVIRLGARSVICNILPILENGQRTGLVLTCMEASAVQRADRRIRSTIRPSQLAARYRLDQISGSNHAHRELLRLAEHYAATHSTILITGESGTGKELLAQGIHNASRRQHGPFVAINCAAFPESLLESELFGYEEGAFSGSRKGGKPGLFEVGHRGTVFLDEIGDMPVSLQTRLLRVLQEKEVTRLGATEPTSIDVRIIAATHHDLRASIEAGRFRKDLYYRLNILRLQTAPLRERAEDIALIAQGIVKRLSLDDSSLKKTEQLLQALLPYFVTYSWPGNIRELENITERAILSAADLMTGEAIEEQRLALLIPEFFEGNQSSTVMTSARDNGEPTLKALGKAAELQHIRQTVESCQGNLERAARQLGISRSTLWRRLRTR